jgi:glycine hydroxymethyltransferase
MSTPFNLSEEAYFRSSLAEVDPELAGLISSELDRQAATLTMVASENLVPAAVLEAQGSILTNKYADGYPGAREYDGCEWVDAIEQLAIDRAKALFHADHANVQAYSGSNANAAVLQALCDPGDPVLGFNFAEGGHPTHYDTETFAGQYYRGFSYGVRQSDRLIDMDQVADLARTHRPKVIFAGWSCYPRVIDVPAFRAIADEVGAALVVDMAHFAGLVAAGIHPDPVPFADVCTMTVHKTLGGARGGAILCRSEFAERIDTAVFPGVQGCPLPQVIAGKAVTFAIAGTPAFADRMKRTVAGARTICETLAAAEGSIRMNVMTGGTDTHQVLLDTAAAGLDANEALEWLHAISVTGNALRIAFDAQPPPGCSGLRLGTTSLATRGFDAEAFVELGAVLAAALGPQRERRHSELVGRVGALIKAFPIYPKGR